MKNIKDYLDWEIVPSEWRPHSSLTGHFSDYLTGLEPSGEWVDDYPATLFLYQIKQAEDQAIREYEEVIGEN